MKASDLIRDALGELGQVSAEQTIRPEKYSIGIRYANRMFRSYAFLPLGFTVLSTPDDEVTIPEYAEEWAIKALAARMAGYYMALEGLDLLKADERVAYANMLKHITLDVSQDLPSILPVGVKNQRISGSTFYPIDDDLELEEDGGYTVVE